MRHSRLAVLASGRGSNFQVIAESCRAGRLSAEVAVVISDQSRAQVLERAKDLDIPAQVIVSNQFPSSEAHDEAMTAAIEQSGATLVCLAGYMRLLGQTFVRRFVGRLVNVHPSLLPAFPGLHGVREALAAGVKVAGCTVHFVEEGVDSGPIITQAAVPVFESDTEETLHTRIQEQEHRILPEAINGLCQDRIKILGRQVVAE